jgi:hypothetical protein
LWGFCPSHAKGHNGAIGNGCRPNATPSLNFDWREQKSRLTLLDECNEEVKRGRFSESLHRPSTTSDEKRLVPVDVHGHEMWSGMKKGKMQALNWMGDTLVCAWADGRQC